MFEGSIEQLVALTTHSDLICEAWLGPGYSMTSQTNIVNPGGKAQEPHRDYRESGHVSFAQCSAVESTSLIDDH